MKNRFSVVGIASLASLAISFLAGLSLFYKEKTASPVEAAIDYSACETAHASNNASDLKTALSNVVKDGSAKTYANLWTAYPTVYGKSDGYIKDYYSNTSQFTTSNQDNGSGGTVEGDKYNREHTIPKSWWGGSTSNQGADIYIVVPADKKINNQRSDNCLGMVGSASFSSNNNYSKLGTSLDGWDFFGSPVFEPNDEVKGDLARIVFYSVIKYNVSSWTTGNGSYVFSGSTSTNFGLTANAVKLFSYWNNLDKPDDWERTVNTRGNTYQGNPNPFIDHPEYANTLWGEVSGYTTYTESTKTLSSITLSNKTTSFEVGDSFIKPTVTANYSDSSSKDVSSSATFSGYNMNSAGNYTVTASYTEGGVTKTATYSITVSSSTKTLSSISVSGAKTSFSVDDSFTFGGTVTAHFSDSSSSNVTSSASFSGYDMSTPGNQTVTVSYTYSGTTKTTTYQITVSSSGGSGGQTQGDSETLIMSEQGFTSGQAASGATGTNCTVTFVQNDGSNGPKYYDTGSAVRVYPSNTITVSSESTIVEITFEFGSGDGSNEITSSPSGFTSPTWSGSANSVAFTIGGTNGHRRIASITVTYESSGSSSDPITSISATVNKTFYVGETITASDITVKDNNNNNVSGFSFTSYQFVYGDASSGGALTNKTFTNAVSFDTLSCNLTVQVQRKAYSAPSGSSSLEHTGSEFSSAGIGSSYATGQTATVDGITFTVDGYIYNSKLSLSSSKTSAPGKVINTTPYPSGITNVSVSGASPNIQLSVDGTNWVNLASASTSTTNYFYLKIAMSNSTQTNFINITSISVTLKASDTPANVANYIMYEDTNGQCTSKFNTAKGYFQSLTSSGRSTFMTSDDYVIETARERLEAWAEYLGRTISYSGGDYVISSSQVISLINVVPKNKTVIVIIFVSLVGLTSIGGYFFIRHRKEN